MDLIPDINDFYKSAPKLYSLAHDSSQSSVIRHAANEVLSEWGSYVVSSREYNQGLQVHHPDIHVVSKDSMRNYVFSSLLHIGVPLEKYIADAGIANLPEKLGDCFDLMSLHYADGIHYMLAHLQKQDFITMFSDATILDKYLKLRLDNASELETSSFKVAQDDPYLQHYTAN
ncbi:uncharacterized protein SPAPADRAFT_62866 [Spathaspora passalidarum NRRL Y-27907]|uniref:Uncharacterized protein n=1 Tax=Spathaspora passalidarum (strain NRRL Y-27907 / 11-Y1) TaxID=619300 RepID=G3ATJ6_SPAPN|nr:uncharacterized protein SPAPADRAFT_62866 [Spathaspora passalidarum NRRL Y-27907]EGW30959.1 hypothetical protein SPAPADRAFT_62866 [Spathaspora passalidarum NRRL Y-27907]